MHENTLKYTQKSIQICVKQIYICGNKLNTYDRCFCQHLGLVDLYIERKVKTFQQLLDLDSTAN